MSERLTDEQLAAAEQDVHDYHIRRSTRIPRNYEDVLAEHCEALLREVAALREERDQWHEQYKRMDARRTHWQRRAETAERAVAEVAALREDNGRLTKQRDDYKQRWAELVSDKVDEIERLRAALADAEWRAGEALHSMDQANERVRVLLRACQAARAVEEQLPYTLGESDLEPLCQFCFEPQSRPHEPYCEWLLLVDALAATLAATPTQEGAGDVE